MRLILGVLRYVADSGQTEKMDSELHLVAQVPPYISRCRRYLPKMRLKSCILFLISYDYRKRA